MSALHITIVRDDEHLSVEVNGEEIVHVSYGEHGWGGMDAVEKTARAIAEAAGIDISEETS